VVLLRPSAHLGCRRRHRVRRGVVVRLPLVATRRTVAADRFGRWPSLGARARYRIMVDGSQRGSAPARSGAQSSSLDCVIVLRANVLAAAIACTNGGNGCRCW
jgi:hypothetical protein